MKLIARIGDCEVELDDGDSEEPASMRWQDQFDRIVVMLHELRTVVVAMHAAKETPMGELYGCCADKDETK